jgi:hypothetical protein
MYSVYYWLNDELYKVCCGRGKEPAAYAWRIVIAYLGNRAWMEFERWN